MRAARADARDALKDPLRNVLSGVAVAVVALPLALAFGRTALGPDIGPAAGLWGAILAGFFAALLGGCPYTITGPTGVLAIFVADLVLAHGGFDDPDALAFAFLAVVLSGIVQIALGLARMGRVIEFIPYPVITGFMSGSALVIVWAGVKDAIDPYDRALTNAEAYAELAILATGAAPAFLYLSVAIMVVVLAIALAWPRYVTGRLPDRGAAAVVRLVPGSLVALAAATAMTLLIPLGSEVQHLHALPTGGPVPLAGWDVLLRHPEWVPDLVYAAVGLALISSIETLLSVVIADSVAGTRSSSNRELGAQGVGNVVAGALGGMQSCGAAVRTMVNVKNGGRSRLSGVSHSLVLLAVLLAGGSAVTLVPIPALSGILIVTGLGMVEWNALRTAHKAPASDTLVMLTTLVVTVAVGIVQAVLLGVVLAALLFIKRMTELSDVVVDAGDADASRRRGLGGDVIVYEIRGPLFFGAANRFSQALERSRLGGRVIVFRMHAVGTTDETGMRTFGLMHDRFRKFGMRVMVVGLPADSYGKFDRFGLVERIGGENFHATVADALAAAERVLRGDAPAPDAAAAPPAARP